MATLLLLEVLALVGGASASALSPRNKQFPTPSPPAESFPAGAREVAAPGPQALKAHAFNCLRGPRGV
jgi:hypothetical protein